jgi:hypothetical protein
MTSKVLLSAALLSLLGLSATALAADQAGDGQATPGDQSQAVDQAAPSDGAADQGAGPSAAGGDEPVIMDPRHKNPPVVFKDVDYKDAGDSGKITVSGRGDPGARLLLYFDGNPFGQVLIGQDGSWSFEKDAKLDMGRHQFRADRVDDTSGIIIGTASVEIARAPDASQSPQ